MTARVRWLRLGSKNRRFFCDSISKLSNRRSKFSVKEKPVRRICCQIPLDSFGIITLSLLLYARNDSLLNDPIYVSQCPEIEPKCAAKKQCRTSAETRQWERSLSNTVRAVSTGNMKNVSSREEPVLLARELSSIKYPLVL